jgi:hypothetical protein
MGAAAGGDALLVGTGVVDAADDEDVTGATTAVWCLDGEAVRLAITVMKMMNARRAPNMVQSLCLRTHER